MDRGRKSQKRCWNRCMSMASSDSRCSRDGLRLVSRTVHFTFQTVCDGPNLNVGHDVRLKDDLIKLTASKIATVACVRTSKENGEPTMVDHQRGRATRWTIML